MDQVAKHWIERALRSSIPEHIPVPYKEIAAARFLKVRKDKTPVAVGTLIMVDGLKAMIEVSKWLPLDDAWTYQWRKMDGGALNWNGFDWERIDAETLLPIEPKQLEFELACF